MNMHERIAKLKTPEECEAFLKNALDRGEAELARAARQRAIELKAARHNAMNDVERECLQAFEAYEAALAHKHGRKQAAGYTRRMLKTQGIIPAVDKIVSRNDAGSLGFDLLVELGLKEYAFENVVLRHPGSFSEKAVSRSRERMKLRG